MNIDERIMERDELLEHLRDKLAAAEAALAIEKHENDRWEIVCDRMEAELLEAQARNASLSGQLVAADDAIETLRGHLAEARAALDEYQCSTCGGMTIPLDATLCCCTLPTVTGEVHGLRYWTDGCTRVNTAEIVVKEQENDK